jgi:transcriptional regulator of acetoin/glycerol metabolism
VATEQPTLPTLKLSELQDIAIDQALKQTDGSVLKAAKLLGIGRATLYRRLHERHPRRATADPRQTAMPWRPKDG